MQPGKKRFYYIYKTTCHVTSRFYIGMHASDVIDDGYLGSGKILKRSIRKHGKEKHSRVILHFEESFELLKKREKELVNECLLDDPLCMNIKIGGDGGFDFINSSREILEGMKTRKQSDEYRSKISAITKSKFEDQDYRERFYLTVKSETYKQKRSVQMKAIFKDPTYRKKISEGKQGEKNPAFGKIWVYKEKVSKLIDPVDFEMMQNDGWIKGRRYERQRHSSTRS